MLDGSLDVNLMIDAWEVKNTECRRVGLEGELPDSNDRIATL